MKQYTAAELSALLAEKYEEYAPEATALMNRWLARGDGVAVYENHDLSHVAMGDVKIVSYGGQMAQLEDTKHDPNPPERLPDGLPAGHINWRYTLIGTYRGAVLEVPEGART